MRFLIRLYYEAQSLLVNHLLSQDCCSHYSWPGATSTGVPMLAFFAIRQQLGHCHHVHCAKVCICGIRAFGSLLVMDY